MSHLKVNLATIMSIATWQVDLVENRDEGQVIIDREIDLATVG